MLLLNPQVCEWRPPEELKRLLDLELRDAGEPHHRLLERCQDIIRYSVKTSKSSPPFICAADSSSISFSMRLSHSRGVPGGSAVKNLPAVQETQEMWARSLGREDPLEEGMATHSSTLAWRIPWTEEPGGLQYMGSQTIRHDRSDLAYADLIVKLAVKFFMDEKPR